MCDGDTAGLSVVQRACGQCRGRGRLAGTRPTTRPQPLDQLRRSATDLLTLPTGSTTTRASTSSCKDRGFAPSSNPSNRSTTSTTSPTSSPVWKARLETALNHAATILTPGGDAALRTLEETTRTLLSELNDAGRAAVEAIEAARAEAEAALRELLNAQLQTLVAEAGRHRMDLADAAQHLASDLQSHTLSHLETLRQQAQLGLDTLTRHGTSLTEQLSTVGQGVLDTLGRELGTAVGALQGAADEGRSWLRTLIEEGVETIIRLVPGGGVFAERAADEVGDAFLGEDGNRRRG